jgi:hypothetical protein
MSRKATHWNFERNVVCKELRRKVGDRLNVDDDARLALLLDDGDEAKREVDVVRDAVPARKERRGASEAMLGEVRAKA